MKTKQRSKSKISKKRQKPAVGACAAFVFGDTDERFVAVKCSLIERVDGSTSHVERDRQRASQRWGEPIIDTATPLGKLIDEGGIEKIMRAMFYPPEQ